jgi:S1-C subfamily serine protease
MKQKRYGSIQLALVAILSFCGGTLLTWQSSAQSGQPEMRRDAQGRFFPTPQALPKQKAAFGMAGRVAFLVDYVATGSPAQQVGLLKRDFIIELDGKQFYSAQDFKQILAEKNAGDDVEVTYYRLNPDSCQREYKKGKAQMAPLTK